MLDHWMDWNFKASDWMKDVHLDAYEKIVVPNFPDRVARMREYWLPEELVGEIQPPQMPLFFRKPMQ